MIRVWVKDANSTKTYDAYAFGTFTLSLPTCSSTNTTSDVASPQSVGTTITFTATSMGCPDALYQWFVRDTAGNWSVVPNHDFAHSSATFAWNTSTLTEGTYQVGVWAKQHLSSNSYDAFAFVTYTLVVAGGHCTVPTLTPSAVSPQATSSSISFTAAASGCSNQLFRFYIRDLAGTWHVVQDFSATTTYNWTSSTSPVNTTAAGTYLVGIWAKGFGSANTYDDFYFLTFTLTSGTPCTVNVAPSPGTGATAGTTVSWTATAANCTAGARYRFWVAPPGAAFGIVQDYNTGNTFSWTQNTPGTYQVGVWILQTGSTNAYDAFAFTTFTLTPTTAPQVCSSVGVTSDVASPQMVSTTVTFTAAANGCNTPQFQWWIRDTSATWAIAKSFANSSNTLVWTTTGLAPGTYLVGVWARQTGSSANYQAYSFVTYTLNVPAAQVCSSVGISPSMASPQMVGPSITFTATAAGCDTPDYAFLLAPPGGAFGLMQFFGAGNAWVWTTGNYVPGPYQVGVWARQHGSTASYEAFAYITFQLQSASVPCGQMTLNSTAGQLITQGGSPNVIASGVTGCASPLYQFYLRSPGSSSFVIVQAYSAAAQYTFNTAPSSRGAYTFLVLARDANSTAALDTYAETDLQVT